MGEPMASTALKPPHSPRPPGPQAPKVAFVHAMQIL